MINLLDSPRDSSQLLAHGAKTFRLSSKMILGKWGGNRQNTEKSMRRIYLCDKGYTGIQRDQSGAEALVVAYTAERGKYRQLFENKIKPHTFVALHAFKKVWLEKFSDPNTVEAALLCDIPDIPKLDRWKELATFIASSDNWDLNERYYYMGKKTVHSSNYGARENMLINSILVDSGGRLILTKQEAVKLLTTYHTLFPEIMRWHCWVQNQITKKAVIRNLFGFPYNYTLYNGRDMDFKSVYSWGPQSTVATITNIALTELQDYIEDEHKQWHLLTTTHDSIFFQVPDAEVEEGLEVSRRFIEKELVGTDGTRFTMKSEASIGRNWAPYKKDSNPEGLKEV